MKNRQENTNLLIRETSPYLLQHAHNPVDWHPWTEETLKKASAADKPLLISIGYAACHWCHVMAHESFEDDETAEIMNKGFICIKVDREERPDIDQIYMDAVQVMTGSGGWPLHCFALPDGRPFYGGTYFPKNHWQQLLHSISKEYLQNKAGLVDYADKLMTGISNPMPIQITEGELEPLKEPLRNMIAGWKLRFDKQFGGENRAPKFPMPVNLSFLLEYSLLEKDDEILDHLGVTMKKMALGGIYDQIGGGFARYSTDAQWKVPHFEKMLYDNAQLISLYSRAYQHTHNPLYEEIVRETFGFLVRELKEPDGLFYSSLDADSEGEEGKFYTWEIDELEDALGADFDFAKSVFKLNHEGRWENNRYILLRKDINEDKQADSASDKQYESLKKRLGKIRGKRIRPSLDDKSLASWNGLMVKALSDAYRAFGKLEYKKTAKETANFILERMRTPEGGLFHSFSKKSGKITGFLEDYAFLIEGLIALHQASLEEIWIQEAQSLTEYVLAHFYSNEHGFFYFSENNLTDVITRKFELIDGVIPSSNAVMAGNLFILSRLIEKTEYEKKAIHMMAKMGEALLHNPGAFSKWGSLYLKLIYPFYEVAIVGAEAQTTTSRINQRFLPQSYLTGSLQTSSLPILQSRFVEGKTLIYICQNKVCQQPVEDAELALEMLEIEGNQP